MSILIIVNSEADWPLSIQEAKVVSAKKYLADRSYSNATGTKVFNLCRSYRYQSVGYYVSLLAEARGHKPIPNITTIQDLKSKSIIRVASEDMEEIIQKSLARIKSDKFVLSVYFGLSLAKQYNRLSQNLFSLFRAPFLRVWFERSLKNRKWYLQTIITVGPNEIPSQHWPFVIDVAQKYFARKRYHARKQRTYRYDLAILHDPSELEQPSNPLAIQKFMENAIFLGMDAEIIHKSDYNRLAEFDALFIRVTTSVNHYSYRFARRAAAEGLVTVDDPESILKCTNKVFLSEILERNRIPVPKTLVLHRDNMKSILESLGLPLILKKPDSSFSQGVVKTETEQEFFHWAEKMMSSSELIIAQEFMPTDYDWRVGVFDRKPLYVCKYYMAREHWQIIKRDSNGLKTDDGISETLLVKDVPGGLLRTALRAANLIGNGFYGVDIKQSGKSYYVIEVNDNPNIDSGVEDLLLKNELYRNIIEVILNRIEKSKEKR